MKNLIYRLIIKLFFWQKNFIGKNILIRILNKIVPSSASINYKSEKIVYSKIENTIVKYLVNGNNYIEDKLIKDGIHSEYIVREILNNYSDNSIIIDVGANIGTITIPTAKSLSRNGITVVACEASTHIYKKLVANIELNKLDNIVPINKAILNTNKTIKLYEQKTDAKNQGLSSIYKNIDLFDYNEIDVETNTLDYIINKLNIKKPVSIIKIDIQGPEYEVLLGAKIIIEKYKPILIFEHEDEYHRDPNERKNSINKYLNDLGYDIFIINPRLNHIRTSMINNAYLNSNLIAFPIR
jgi:FkbM family methyltransferase